MNPFDVGALAPTEKGILPSERSAVMLLRGEPGGVPAVLGSTVARGAILAAGLYAVGFRKCDLVKGALAGAVAIELFVLGYTAWMMREDA